MLLPIEAHFLMSEKITNDNWLFLEPYICRIRILVVTKIDR